MSNTDKYLDLSLNDIDKILGGISLDEKKVEEKQKLACKSCTGTKLYMDNSKGYFVCEDCGVINDEILDDNPEFNNDINGKSRYGAPSNYFFPKSSLGTKIKSRGYNRISALQRQGQMPYREKSLLGVLGRIQTRCKKAGITQNIQNNIKILAYKETDLSHLTDNDYLQCLNRSNMCIPNLIKRIHFNPKKPENHNIYISNIKNKYVMIYDGGKWNLHNRDETIDNLIDTNEDVLEQKLEEWIENGKDYPEIMKKFNRYLEKKEKDEVINKVKEEIKLILFNNRKIVDCKEIEI